MLTWADDFDGPAGSAPGPWWTAEVGAGGDRELQTYRAGNAALDGSGRLALTARNEPDGTLSSARLITKGAVTVRHGCVEARIRVPAGQGVWPADVPSGAWRFEHEFYLLLNLAIGGPWPGNQAEEPGVPATMLVDWVRVSAEAPSCDAL